MKRVVGVTGLILASVLGSGVCPGQTMPSGRYFGQTPPGSTPEVFAPGVISLASRYEYCLVFSPDGNECVFGLTNSGWSGFNLLYTRMGADSVWIDPVPAPFQGSGDAVYPTFSVDGGKILFASSRPTYPPMRLWQTAREGEAWSDPEALDSPVFSGADEWGSSLTSDGTLYFCSDRTDGLGGGDIYRALRAPDGTVTVENVGDPINTPQLEGAPRIAPDESYLVFESRRPGGYGSSDLYISFREDGEWTLPRNLGPAINTTQIEDGPFVSPDGKYLFFNRRRAPYTTEPSEIWWVDARAALDPGTSTVEDPEPPLRGASSLRITPNPCGSSGSLTYAVPSYGLVSIRIFDLQGREVCRPVQAPRAAGTYSEPFEVPRDAANGLYFCRLQVGDRWLGTAKFMSLR